MGLSVFPVGSRVCITSYSPFRGLRGTVRTVHTIADDADDPFCFYLIALDGAHFPEPVWFECTEVAFVSLAVAPEEQGTPARPLSPAPQEARG